MNLEPDERTNPITALHETLLDLQACARLAEGLAQQTDIYPRVLCEATAGLSRSLQADAARLGRVVLPALNGGELMSAATLATLAVKDGNGEAASAELDPPAGLDAGAVDLPTK